MELIEWRDKSTIALMLKKARQRFFIQIGRGK